RIDAEYLPVLQQVPKIDLQDIPAARAALHAVFALMGTPPPHEEVERSDIAVPNKPGSPDAKIRLYRPKIAAETLPGLIWIQGGGYVLTANDPDDQWCEHMAHELQCVVAS